MATIKGVDKNNRTVWIYKTRKYEATELDSTAYIVHSKYVYIYEGSKIVKLNKQTGKKLWTVKNVHIASPQFKFDKNNNLYAIGYYANTLYKISNDGKIKWSKKLRSTKCYWPSKIKCSGTKVQVTFASNEDTEDTCYVWLKSSNGKIIKISK